MKTSIRPATLLRLAVTLAWLGLVVTLLELPSDVPFVAALSSLFGQNDIGYAFGHVVVFGITTFVLRWAFGLFLASRAAGIWGVGGAMALGIATELLQFNTRNRGVSLLDLAANIVGVMLVGMWFVVKSSNRNA